MRKLVFIFAILPMLAIDLAPGKLAMAETNNLLVEFQSGESSSEASEKSEAEKKITFKFDASIKKKKFLSGHLLLDHYAIPPERHYLPYEPPIA